MAEAATAEAAAATGEATASTGGRRPSRGRRAATISPTRAQGAEPRPHLGPRLAQARAYRGVSRLERGLVEGTGRSSRHTVGPPGTCRHRRRLEALAGGLRRAHKADPRDAAEDIGAQGVLGGAGRCCGAGSREAGGRRTGWCLQLRRRWRRRRRSRPPTGGGDGAGRKGEAAGGGRGAQRGYLECWALWQSLPGAPRRPAFGGGWRRLLLASSSSRRRWGVMARGPQLGYSSRTLGGGGGGGGGGCDDGRGPSDVAERPAGWGLATRGRSRWRRAGWAAVCCGRPRRGQRRRGGPAGHTPRTPWQ